MRVALVHDYLTQFGGAERVLLALMELFPNAPVFTLVHDAAGVDTIDRRRLRTSWLQALPLARRHHRYFPLLMPLAAEQLDLRGFDVVLSASHSFGKGVITGPDTLHIVYCFTPTRYVWDDSHRYVREFSRSPFFRRLAPLGLSYIRRWDYFAAQRPDIYLTLSAYVARRIEKYYGRSAQVIPPPVEVDRFAARYDPDGTGDYYLIVSRLVPYKRVDLAIEACEKLGRRLKIAGSGPEEAELRSKAGTSTEFLGFVSDAELPALYGGAKALLFPQEEDFGITPLEAAASGKPTVAYRAGGALETIIENKTGIFFDHQSVGDVMAAIRRFETQTWDPFSIRRHALSFSKEHFLRRMEEVVHTEWLRFSTQNKEHRIQNTEQRI